MRPLALIPVVALTLGSVGVLAQKSGLTVAAAGIRVIGPGVGENATEIRPFNYPAGTTVVLLVKAPPGTGIVDIDDDASRLDSATDDKGTDLREDVDFDTFPNITRDGSAALMDVTVDARPASGASTISLAGSLAVSVARGTKPSKASLALKTGATAKLGTAVVTVGEMEAGDDSTTVTLQMSRSVMESIKGFTFLDAKGGALESDRRSSGYMGDSAELSYRVNTTAKAVTLVADIWQQIATVQVPFKLSVSLGL